LEDFAVDAVAAIVGLATAAALDWGVRQLRTSSRGAA
jgi:hypothetical protein